MAENQDEHRGAQMVGVGCVTAIAGFFSGGMIGVFIAKMVGSFRGCEPDTGLPACDWHVYAGIGMLIGVITLPALALNRLRQRNTVADNKDRGE
jgi:MFS family permease